LRLSTSITFLGNPQKRILLCLVSLRFPEYYH